MSAEHIAVLTPHSYLPRSLQGVLLISEGYLILRGASRLDAFSVYPCRTWLLCHGFGSQQMHCAPARSTGRIVQISPSVRTK